MPTLLKTRCWLMDGLTGRPDGVAAKVKEPMNCSSLPDAKPTSSWWLALSTTQNCEEVYLALCGFHSTPIPKMLLMALPLRVFKRC